MRSPRGFGKNYFTLSAIQAYASAHRLSQNAQRIRIHRENRLQIADEISEAGDPPDELLLTVEPLPSQGGLCNCRFARLSRLCLRHNTHPKVLVVSPIHTYSTLSPPFLESIRTRLLPTDPIRKIMKPTLFISLITASALAATLGANEVSFDPIVVSATKTEESLNSLSANIHILTSEEIEERHYLNVAEALNSLPGISITANGGLGTTQSVFVRGMDTNRVLVLINGIRYQDPSNTSGASFAHLMIGDISRIEVIKGAQSGIWGADASAGVINIITKEAQQGTHTGFTAEAGSFSTRKWGGFVSHKTDTFDLKLALERVMSDGFTAQAPKGKDIFAYENDPYANTTLNLSGHYRPTPNDTLGLHFTDINALSNYDGYNAPDSTQRSDVRTKLYGLNYDRKGEDHTLSLKANRSVFKRDELDTTYGVKVFNGTTEQLELNDRFGYRDTDFIVAGIMKESYDVDYVQANNAQAQMEVSSKGLYLTNSNSVGNLILTETIRRDDYTNFSGKTTGKLGAKYRFTPDLYLSGNYGTAYTAPSLIQILNPWGATNTSLKPENTKSRDVTIGYHNLTATYFENRVTDLVQWYDPTPLDWSNNDPYYTNLNGTSSFKGYELSYHRNLPGSLALTTNYTHLSDFKDQNGKDLARRPKREAKLALDYYGIDRLHVGLNGYYVGTRYDRANQSGDQTGRYTVLNLAANYALTPAVQLYGKIDNLTDKRYQNVSGYTTSPRAWYIGLRASF